MYIWVTCRLPEAFEREQRVSIRQTQEEIGLPNAGTRPEPMYIALIKPAWVEEERVQAILTRMETLLRREKPFVIQLAEAELAEHAVAMRIRPNGRLTALHAALVRELMPQAADAGFHFNLPVLLCEEEEALLRFYREWSQYSNEELLGIERFVLLCSEDGKTYRTVTEITV